jgi:hypothetical protein
MQIFNGISTIYVGLSITVLARQLRRVTAFDADLATGVCGVRGISGERKAGPITFWCPIFRNCFVLL